ncbi:MAG: N-acetylmuramoyl-L-alanine amidase [Candidatus Woesearchaeota archaeon]|jgi:N-acetylmuramoyl-L-alanine amidase|nr:N-acetylmuramoyl-L-alanine amidase [Candidatus Woesearchaeota archaeon]
MTKLETLNIILDPAHGEETPGKRSPDGNHREYLWSRQRCVRIKKKLEILGYNVYITNETPNEIGITNRKNIANKLASGNTLLISLHNNAFGEG